ncbi:hypothetical protein [Pedobacter sp.]|uniref:hypothetical protein n=1 Tax=Pedobacter sp. TaxID=1411316 RepID=UPI003C62DD57
MSEIQLKVGKFYVVRDELEAINSNAESIIKIVDYDNKTGYYLGEDGIFYRPDGGINYANGLEDPFDLVKEVTN